METRAQNAFRGVKLYFIAHVIRFDKPQISLSRNALLPIAITAAVEPNTVADSIKFINANILIVFYLQFCILYSDCF